METKLTFDWLPVLAVILSLLASYLPKFKTWYEALESGSKQLFMLGILLLAVLGGVLLSYFGFINLYGGPTWTWKEWVWFPLLDYIFAVMANAGTYVATKHISPAAQEDIGKRLVEYTNLPD